MRKVRLGTSFPSVFVCGQRTVRFDGASSSRSHAGAGAVKVGGDHGLGVVLVAAAFVSGQGVTGLLSKALGSRMHEL